MNIIHLIEWTDSDVVSFDFDDTLCWQDGTPNTKMMRILKSPHDNGYECIIVTSRNLSHEDESWIKENEPQRTPVQQFIQAHGLPVKKVYFTDHAPKGPILSKLQVVKHYDDKDDELRSANMHGVVGIKVTSR